MDQYEERALRLWVIQVYTNSTTNLEKPQYGEDEFSATELVERLEYLETLPNNCVPRTAAAKGVSYITFLRHQHFQ